MGKGFRKVTDSLGMTDSGAADRAMSAQGAATDKSIAFQKEMYGENKARLMPYIDQGKRSFDDLVQLGDQHESFSQVDSPLRGHSGVFTNEDFEKDPGYQFRMDEGLKGVNRMASAGGGMGGGRNMKELMRYGQGFASNEFGKASDRFNQNYNNAYNRFGNDRSSKFNTINTLAGYGSNANSMLAGQGSQMAKGVSENLVGMGNAQASMEMNRNADMRSLWQTGAQAGATAYACWVARAIFGKNNPKWKQARNFILNIGPNWFRNIYLKHGESFAKKVEKSKVLKLALKPFFEYMAYKGRDIPKPSILKYWGLYAS